MAHLFRFLATRISARHWELNDDEWHHLLKVLHLPVGCQVELVDGRGWLARARIVELDKKSGRLEIDSELQTPPRHLSSRLILAIGALKPQSADELIPYLVELGVDEIRIFSSSMGDKGRIQEKVQERWDRLTKAAIKQCKRTWIPSVIWSNSLQEFIASCDLTTQRLYLDPHARLKLNDWQAPKLGPTIALIGSEKGLDPSEVGLLEDNGFIGCRIEGAILRATTAAIATAALLRQKLSSDAVQSAGNDG